MRAAVATFLIALPTAPAFAQPPATDPVVAHFRDYRAAIDHQDLCRRRNGCYRSSRSVRGRQGLADGRISAESGAPSADACRTGSGARTCCTRPRVRDEPYRHRASIPCLRSLTLGRAELEANVAAGADRLEASIEEAEMRRAFLAEAYAAAVSGSQIGRRSTKSSSDRARRGSSPNASLLTGRVSPDLSARAARGSAKAQQSFSAVSISRACRARATTPTRQPAPTRTRPIQRSVRHNSCCAALRFRCSRRQP